MEQVFRIQVDMMLEKHPKSIQQAVIKDLNATLNLLGVDSINLEVVALMIVLAKKAMI